MKGLLCGAAALILSVPALADEHDENADYGERNGKEHYVIDTEGAHAFIQFKIDHLGFSWLLGRFNDFEGEFIYDTDDPSNSSVDVVIQTTSIDSNHEERDEHLRSDDFLTVEEHPESTFVSTSFTPGDEDGEYTMVGDFTLNGVTREVEIDVKQIGAGRDPWGNYRRGFEGSTVLTLADFDIDYDLGERAETLEIFLSIEGILKDDEENEDSEA